MAESDPGLNFNSTNNCLFMTNLFNLSEFQFLHLCEEIIPIFPEALSPLNEMVEKYWHNVCTLVVAQSTYNNYRASRKIVCPLLRIKSDPSAALQLTKGPEELLE